MNYLNKFGNMVSKGIDVVKTQINTQIKSDNPSYNSSLPKNVHILGVEDNSQNNYQQPQQQNDDYSKFYYGQLNYQPTNNNNNPQQKPVSSSMMDLFNINKPQTKIKAAKPDKEFLQGFNLINGENSIEWEKCIIKLATGLHPVKTLLTNYRVSIMSDSDIKNNNVFSYYPSGYFSLPIHKIEKVTKIDNNQSFEYFIEITMDDLRVFTLIFKANQNETLFNVLNGIIKCKETPSFSQLAYEYNKTNPIYQKENCLNGWNLYDPEKEFQRQGLTNLDYEVAPNKKFRKTNLNENYSLCDTYPKFLVTVASISDSNYKESSLFRTKNRLPALAYFHYNSKGTIWRSAQAKTGLSGNRNRFDEELMNQIGEISNTKKLFIFDCRPYLAAMANRLKGAGHENVDNYNNAEIFFCEIDNIHSARNALTKLYNMLKPETFYENKKYFSTFENSGWPNFVFGIINASLNVANSVKRGHSILIHCSDGWDRASQVTAFSQLLIDPFFRTIKGYMTLIEKDFVSFGHQFRFRNGYYSKETQSDNQVSPILLQFLDATHQLLVQYPMYFEFNMKFLLFIANSIHSGLYGTFLYNNEKEREQKNAKVNTMSCWTEILNNIDDYKNVFYEKKSADEYFFMPKFPFSRIRLWEEYFMPFTQISIGISYDDYVNRWYGSYFNIFGQARSVKSSKNRMITNEMFHEKEKEEYIKNLEKKNKEIQHLKNAIAELSIKNNLSRIVCESLSKESIDVLKNVAKENGGTFEINDDNTEYVFTKTKNDKKPDTVIKNEVTNNEQEGEKTNLELLQNKIVENVPQNNEGENQINQQTEAVNNEEKLD